ncbi:hypothetical protein DICVIV_04940 [Dictyocaulus viviparus]|uniref:Uncharacterized protein n=1 Tax=Dictyocaulus viviparus TaxID=29172 RepID=A0A0D8Y2V9_DICVI|nr:hypothetical protein DICVIV_04940 [Dictyocaulus viviparus]
MFAGQNALKLLITSNITALTPEEVQMSFQGIKIVASFIIEVIMILCIITCVLIYNIDFLAKKLPTVVIIVILIFVVLFNIAELTILILYVTAHSQSDNDILGCTYVSGGSLFLTILVIVCFFFLSLPQQTTSQTPKAIEFSKHSNEGDKSTESKTITQREPSRIYTDTLKSSRTKKIIPDYSHLNEAQYENLVDLNK